MSSVNLSDVPEPITLEGLAEAVQANTRELRWALEAIEKQLHELQSS